MKQPITLALVFIAALMASLQSMAQCASGTLCFTATAYAMRVGALAQTYVYLGLSGVDAEYTVPTITQTNKLNGTQYATSANTGSEGGYAESVIYTNINTQGFGTYTVQGYLSGHDLRTGQFYPPLVSGSPYTNIAQFGVQQPVAGLSSNMYVANFIPTPVCQPNVGCTQSGGTFTNSALLNAVAQGITAGLPVWTLSGSTQMVTANCTNCKTVTLTGTSQAIGSCTPVIAANYVWDGLKSTTVNMAILAPVQINALDPDYQVHEHDYVAYGGYESDWYFQIVNSCGLPMGNVNMHEAFSGFTYKYAGANWAFPSANTFIAGGTGLWYDNIGEKASPAFIPPVLGPQTPLGSTPIYSSPQQIFVVNYQVANYASQTHFQDHGGYQ